MAAKWAQRRTSCFTKKLRGANLITQAEAFGILKKKKKKTFLWLNKNRKTFFFEGFISPLHCVAYFSLKTFQDVRVKSVEHNIDRDIDQAKY